MAESIFKSFCMLFLTDYCYHEFFTNFNFLHVECLKAFISKGLGVAIVAGSILVKVPQIIKIFKAQSAQGISLFGVSLELFAVLSNVSYNFVNGYPFSAYGDGFFLLIQTSLIGSMVLHYAGAKQLGVLFSVAVASLSILLSSGLTPLRVLWILQATNIPIVFSAKMIQAWANFQNGSTGQLSAITIVLLFFGSAARIFTSIQETGDPVIIVTYLASTLANSVILGQLIMYWNVPVKSKVSKSKKKQ
ncbi:UNVERIFIED_CONTAM: hypothetical protein GTU68_043482 [Idotea baltica]|nr:hypothetical protein [Idotea baltica]